MVGKLSVYWEVVQLLDLKNPLKVVETVRLVNKRKKEGTKGLALLGAELGFGLLKPRLEDLSLRKAGHDMLRLSGVLYKLRK